MGKDTIVKENDILVIVSAQLFFFTIREYRTGVRRDEWKPGTF